MTTFRGARTTPRHGRRMYLEASALGGAPGTLSLTALPAASAPPIHSTGSIPVPSASRPPTSAPRAIAPSKTPTNSEEAASRACGAPASSQVSALTQTPPYDRPHTASRTAAVFTEPPSSGSSPTVADSTRLITTSVRRGDRPALDPAAKSPRTPVPYTSVNTLQKGLSLVAANRGSMLLCRSTADHHSRRGSLAFIPVESLPASLLGLIRPRAHTSAQARAFAQALSETVGDTRPSGPGRFDA
ncbi:hypothetical protein GCM10010272_31050 [Streptomyces lateritius]|nr:hypothetical protein GCM10010272_31050 [Streptomyces lateritius]